MLFSNFDGTDTDYDQTLTSHFGTIFDSIKSVEWQKSDDKLRKDILLFYSEIIQLKLDEKDKLEEDEKEMVCRDLCPKHLLADMLNFG